MLKVKGIHHVSSIVRHPQENIDFYAGVLGLSMIKKTVNFDDPNTYHFYFGNYQGDSGTITTFFPWSNKAREGFIGDGQVGVTTYAIPEKTMNFWEQRLNKFHVPFYKTERFGQNYLNFKDTHGIELELVESDLGTINQRGFNGVDEKHAIKGFFGVTLFSINPKKTADFLTEILGLKITNDDERYERFETEASIGKYIDLSKESQGLGKMGANTVHHLAFEVELDELEKWHEMLIKENYHPSEIKDRSYFKSIYFKEPGGIIIELAAKVKDFGIENMDYEGKHLFLPSQYETIRLELENVLTPVFIRSIETLEEFKYQNKSEYDAWFAHKELLRKINDFARLAKERKLTEEENNQRNALRRQYVESVTYGVRNMVDSIQVQEEDGSYKSFDKKGTKVS